MNPVKISIVSYLNSIPFVQGLKSPAIQAEIDLSLDNPAQCAKKLADGEVDIGLIPVAVLLKLPHYQIVGDFCIGATGPVSSVMLYSNVPLDKIERIHLDYQSRTSVALVQVLAKFHWKIQPQFIPANQGYEEQISGTDGGVVIGDRTFLLNSKYAHAYDLAAEWYNFTGLPFVFACWVSTVALQDDFISRFNLALKSGLDQIPQLSKQLQAQGKYPTDVEKYLTHYIQYNLTEEKRKGLQTFLNFLPQL